MFCPKIRIIEDKKGASKLNKWFTFLLNTRVAAIAFVFDWLKIFIFSARIFSPSNKFSTKMCARDMCVDFVGDFCAWMDYSGHKKSVGALFC